MYVLCDSTWENDPYRAKLTFSVEVKISDAVIHCQSSFYFSLSIFSMSPTFRRAVRVQKCLLVTERGHLKELLKLKSNACSFTKSPSIEITLKRSRALRSEFPGI